MTAWGTLASVSWDTLASAATALGTLVLALATFSVVRSGRRSAVATEVALMAGIKPLLLPSHMDDPDQKVSFADEHWVHVGGGMAAAEATADAVYLVVSLRNVGNGLAILDRWDLTPHDVFDPADAAEFVDRASQRRPRQVAQFRRLSRALYIPTGELGFWHGALRDPSEELFKFASEAVVDRRALTLDLLYSDVQGGQMTISRFTLRPVGEDRWLTTIGRHFDVDDRSSR
ncbi:MAG TPA: hypothetical protein VMF65_18845 [Acidimicrobiales bacterium]|nr:hypothetical protein [Acidimicrobiales bacterium]